MSNKDRLSAFNRSNILSAASALFREKGMFQTTMDDIAKKADYSKSTVYVYFKSKDDIYNHIVLEHFQMHRDAVAEALRKAPGFPEGYFAICNAMAAFYEANPLYFESILGEISLDTSDPVLKLIYDVGEDINAIIGEYILKCVSSKHVSMEAPPLQTTFTLWAGISGIITLANKKERYIEKSMNRSKEQFMQNGFELLLKSITMEVLM